MQLPKLLASFQLAFSSFYFLANKVLLHLAFGQNFTKFEIAFCSAFRFIAVLVLYSLAFKFNLLKRISVLLQVFCRNAVFAVPACNLQVWRMFLQHTCRCSSHLQGYLDPELKERGQTVGWRSDKQRPSGRLCQSRFHLIWVTASVKRPKKFPKRQIPTLCCHWTQLLFH